MLESQNTTDFVAGLLRPLPGSACGIDLEYDADFLELERLLQGKPQQQMGSVLVPGEEPAWNQVLERSVALFGRTKDLRVAVTMARALLAQGFAGLSDGLSLLRGLVEQHWNEVYPRLDSTDGNPTFRLNILSGLCDGLTFTDRVRALPLVVSRSFGRFSLRDLAIASGESAPQPKAAAPQASAIEGAFSTCALTDLQATEAQLRGALDHLLALEKALAARIGQAKGPDFSPLARLLEQAHKVVSGHVARRGTVAPAPCTDAAPPTLSAPASDTVSSRDEVVRLLDRLCTYYDRHEPASPLPLLLRRCKRLVSASFFEIVRDLAPAGLPQVESLRGKDA